MLMLSSSSLAHKWHQLILREEGLIPGDYRKAVTGHAFMPRLSRVLRDDGLRYEAADCLLGLHPERAARDRRISGVDMFVTCKDCGLLKTDWDTTHELYRPWSDQCGPCKSEYIAEEVALDRRRDV